MPSHSFHGLQFALKLVPFLSQEVIDSGKTNLHFVRVHAPWVVLCKYAEELNLRAPIQVSQKELPTSKIGSMISIVVLRSAHHSSH